jgi:dCTP diphosphatase
MSDDINKLTEELRSFAAIRDWEQFHSPKNLAMALAGECGEVLEHFQWLTEQQSNDLDNVTRREVGHELADVFLYTLRLADRLNINLVESTKEKLQINAQRYPADRVRGDARRAGAYLRDGNNAAAPSNGENI